MSAPAHVRKRNGRLEPFKEYKLAESIYRAGIISDMDDLTLARQWAGLVADNVTKDNGVARSQDIHETVTRILTETGHYEIARIYESLRELKQNARERLWLRSDAGSQPNLFGEIGQENGAKGRRWQRHALQKALIKDLGLDESLAEDITRSVESRLLATGLDGFTPDLVAEIINHEMFERGIPRRSMPWGGVPDTLGEAYLFPPAGRTGLARLRAAGVENHLAAGFISQEIVEAHRNGLIFMEGFPIGACLGKLTLEIDKIASELPRGGSPDILAARTAGAVCALAGLSLRPVTLLGVGKWLHSSQPGDGLRNAMARSFFTAMLASDHATPLPAPVSIRIGTARQHGDMAIINALQDLGPSAFQDIIELQSVFPGGRCPPPAKAALELIDDEIVQTVSYASVRGFQSQPAVAINLMNIAYACGDAGHGDVTEFLDRLTGRVDLALLAQAEWREWQRRQFSPEGRVGRLLARCGLERFFQAKRKWRVAITPVGLHPALAHLLGDDAANGTQGLNLAVETLNAIETHARSVSANINLNPMLDAGPSPYAAKYFSRVDAGRFTAARTYLMTGDGIRISYDSGSEWMADIMDRHAWRAVQWNTEVNRAMLDGGRPLEVTCDRAEDLDRDIVELSNLLHRELGTEMIRFTPGQPASTKGAAFDFRSLSRITREKADALTLFDILEKD